MSRQTITLDKDRIDKAMQAFKARTGLIVVKPSAMINQLLEEEIKRGNNGN